MKSILPGELVLITGGSGSLGTHVLERLKERTDIRLRVMSRHEKAQYDLRQRFPYVDFMLGDVRDAAAVRRAVAGVSVVIHAASLKYVDISEKQSSEYVKTNVLGTVNMLEAIQADGGVRRCVGVSTDKISHAVNTYGHTKALLEKLFLEASRQDDTVFTVARYGNVTATRGSVVPYWAQLRRNHKSLPLTDPDMTRFFFSLDEAVDLLEVALQRKSGEIVSKRMRAARLGDVAEVMQSAGVDIVGRRPGEKIAEMLLTSEEMARCQLIEGTEYLVYEPGRWIAADTVLPPPYTSDNAPRLSLDELKILLAEYL